MRSHDPILNYLHDAIQLLEAAKECILYAGPGGTDNELDEFDRGRIYGIRLAIGILLSQIVEVENAGREETT